MEKIKIKVPVDLLQDYSIEEVEIEVEDVEQVILDFFKNQNE